MGVLVLIQSVSYQSYTKQIAKSKMNHQVYYSKTHQNHYLVEILSKVDYS